MRFIIPVSNVSEDEVEKACVFGFGFADVVELWADAPFTFPTSHAYQYIGKLNNAQNKEELCKFYVKKGWFVDIDIENDLELIGLVPKEQLLLSFHDFSGIPDLLKIIEKMEALSPSIYKISVTPNAETDLKNFVNWAKEIHQKHTFIFTTMGKLGTKGRKEIYDKHLSYAHFSPLTEEHKTESSQLTLDQWQSLF